MLICTQHVNPTGHCTLLRLGDLSLKNAAPIAVQLEHTLVELDSAFCFHGRYGDIEMLIFSIPTSDRITMGSNAWHMKLIRVACAPSHVEMLAWNAANVWGQAGFNKKNVGICLNKKVNQTLVFVYMSLDFHFNLQ